jgi:hypothetical protein
MAFTFNPFTGNLDYYAAASGATFTSGNTATMLSTSGTTGQTFYNTSYNAWWDWVVDHWVPRIPDPRYGFYQYDEFWGSDRIGQLDWQTNGSSPSAAGNALNPGIYTLSQATASNLTYLASQGNSLQLGTADIFWEALVSIPALSNGTDNACYVIGLHDGFAYSATGACTDGVYFTLDPTNANWLTNTSSNGSLTSKTSTTAPVAGTFYRLGIYINAAASATFYVNGTAITTAHVTNIPSGAGRQTATMLAVHKTLGASARTMSADYVSVYGFFNGQRVS